jgi:hypothetical protein
LQGAYGCKNELWTGNGYELFLEAQDKHKELHPEIVGVDDSLGFILWACYFMIEQGYDMDALLLYQDNMSTILLETNGRASSLKHTKHIKVKYSFIKDKVDQGEITIEYSPTKQMWTDINMKSKQGLVFRVFRGHVMGIPVDYKDSDYEGKVPLTPPIMSMLPLTKEQLSSQECVGGKRVTNKEVEIWDQSLTKDRRVKHRPTKNIEEQVTNKEIEIWDQSLTKDRWVTFEPKSQLPSPQAPINMIGGRAWSPGVYRALRLQSKSLDVAWERAFICPLTL